jgi:dTDP-4-amino-4,6-dideoxygalactose transaminase
MSIHSLNETRAGAGARKRHRLLSRRVAMLGGTTSVGDCFSAAAFLLKPHRLVRGPSVREYESAFANYIGVRHSFSFSSGRVSLFGILMALGIGEGDEVIIQVPTHIVVANAIRYTGARPVFTDSDSRTCNVDLASLERTITARTKAIVLQHTFGIPADLDAVLRLCRERGIDVIEDCVHALGATYKGAPVGSFGRAGFFSTEESKTISTTMGGMAVTNDEELAGRLQEFQQQCAAPSALITGRYLLKLVLYHVLTVPRLLRYLWPLYEAVGRPYPVGRAVSAEESRGATPPHYECRLSNAQALLGLRQLSRIGTNLAHRERIVAAYQAQLQALGFDMPRPPAHASPAYVRFPLYVEDQQAAVSAAASYANLGTWFTSVLLDAADPRIAGYVPGSCLTAELLCQRLVNLPVHRRVSIGDVDAIVASLGPTRDTLPPKALGHRAIPAAVQLLWPPRSSSPSSASRLRPPADA